MLRQKYILAVSVILTCLVVVNCQEQPTSLNDLINSVFNTNPSSTESTNTFQPVPTKTTVLNKGGSGINDGSSADGGRSCGFQKECVKRFLCKDDKVVTDGIGLIDIRFDGDSQTECGYLEVCCDLPNKVNEPTIPIRPPEQHVGCGYRNPNGVGFKIVGGSDESEFGEFPWMVAVLREEKSVGDTLNLYECGGSILTPTVVLTASHCVQTRRADELTVRAGEWDTQTKTEILPHQDRRVKEIIVHEKYNKGSLYNDIALLILDEPFVAEENVRPICLPDAGHQQDYARCFATGWGKDKFGKDGQYQVFLKKIELPLVDHNTCQKNLRTTRLGAYFQLHESFTCAGGEKNKDTCKGDGGSPLVCPMANDPKRYYQAGIVAWGIGCGEENIPGVYAKVSHLRPWIDDKLSARQIDFQHFTAV